MLTPDLPKVILASGSPRRRELMESVGFEVVVRTSDVPEEHGPGEDGAEYTSRLAQAKAAAVATHTTTADPQWLLAADTVVVCDDAILEKPADHDDALRMLRMLRGRWHDVITSFRWHDCVNGTGETVTIVTRVRFGDVEDALLRQYVATEEPMDKAGAYGIQGLGAALVDEIEGSYTAVVGLPIAQVIGTLVALGGVESGQLLRAGGGQ